MTMTNTIPRRLFFAAIISLLTILPAVILAQTEQAEEVEPAATSTSDNASTVTENDTWYRSDKIIGKKEVGDFVVGPGRTELNLKPGETRVQEIAVTNRISDNRTFKLEVEDIFGSSDGSRAVNLTGDSRGPYSILDYITIPEDTFTLKLGERAYIPVTVSIPEDAEPGGFYGSVLVSTVQKPDSSEEPQSAATPIIARVGSLFFLTIDGDISIEGKTVSVSTISDKLWYQSGPVNLGILYENTGSLHVNPYGEVSVTNMFGDEVGFIELEPWFVLPKSLRNREITWDRELLLGRYEVTAKVNRGYDDIVDEVSTVFWVLPWKIVGGVFLGLFVTLFLIRMFFRTFEFKRKGS